MTTEPHPLTSTIASSLGETDSAPLTQIDRALFVCGPERVQAALAAALQIESEGGLPTPDGSRRRTPGGVFFLKLREAVSAEEWHRIHYQSPAVPPQPVKPPMNWAERVEAAQAAAQAGRAVLTSVGMWVFGRPTTIKKQDDFVVLTIEADDPLPTIAHDLPDVPDTRTTYKVCLGYKQWRKVKEPLRAPNAVLGAYGYAMPNIKQKTIVLLGMLANAHIQPREDYFSYVKLTGSLAPTTQRGATLVMQADSARAPQLPTDLPEPPEKIVAYTLYIGEKQWRKASQRLGAPPAAMSLQGLCFFDSDLDSIAVLSQNLELR